MIGLGVRQERSGERAATVRQRGLRVRHAAVAAAPDGGLGISDTFSGKPFARLPELEGALSPAEVFRTFTFARRAPTWPCSTTGWRTCATTCTSWARTRCDPRCAFVSDARPSILSRWTWFEATAARPTLRPSWKAVCGRVAGSFRWLATAFNDTSCDLCGRFQALQEYLNLWSKISWQRSLYIDGNPMPYLCVLKRGESSLPDVFTKRLVRPSFLFCKSAFSEWLRRSWQPLRTPRAVRWIWCIFKYTCILLLVPSFSVQHSFVCFYNLYICYVFIFLGEFYLFYFCMCIDSVLFIG